MRYNVHLDVLEGRTPGVDKTHCLICALGFQDEVDRLAKKGKKPKEIKQRLSFKYKKAYSIGKPRRIDILNHIGAHGMGFNRYSIMKKASEAIMKEKKSLAQVQESILDNISRSIDLTSNISQEELEKMSIKDKLLLFDRMTKLLQGEKKIAISANAQKHMQDKYIVELNELSALGSDGNDK